ncbi:MAG: DUF6644 family protein [Pseudomonadales bacterium]
MDVLFLFEWLDTSLLAQISKSSGGVFAAVQTVHLGAMALLGGMLLVSDLRLLNVLMKDVPVQVVMENTRNWITIALVAMILSGIFMASAVAIKLYYNMFFWSKMAGLVMGLIFFYGIKTPLIRGDEFNTLNPWILRLVAIASLTIWFSVAASGRWIGFS